MKIDCRLKTDNFYTTLVPGFGSDELRLVMSIPIADREAELVRGRELEVIVKLVPTPAERLDELRRKELLQLPCVNASNIDAIVKAFERADLNFQKGVIEEIAAKGHPDGNV